jgi:hypothetical protein
MCSDTNIIRVTPKHTNRCVLNPAGLPLLSLSHPISPPKTVAISNFPNTVPMSNIKISPKLDIFYPPSYQIKQKYFQ